MSSNLSSSFLQFKVEMSKVSNHSIYRFDGFGFDAEKLMLYARDRKFRCRHGRSSRRRSFARLLRTRLSDANID